MSELLQNVIDALSLGSIYALVALGIGLLFGILRLINFAQGDFITIGCYALIVPSTDVTARMLIGAWSWPVLIPSICLIVVVIALLTDVLVFRPLRRAYSPTLMIASFAVSYIIQNGVLMIYGSRPKAVNLWSEPNTRILIGGLRLPLFADRYDSSYVARRHGADFNLAPHGPDPWPGNRRTARGPRATAWRGFAIPGVEIPDAIHFDRPSQAPEST